jgi:eukaryotic-like serine/threonine-protein kinase
VSLTVGARLGPYEVTAQLGAGGMGEVYRARDTKLNRDVALKVLPAPFAADPERLARLMREAQLLASLNHPNIASIHGLEDAGDTRALVLELVEGPTLADRIAQGPIPLDEALAIARQILDALEAAHEHGIIHRDLKPANIKVRADGMVKVLDFGLAKALEPTEGGSVAATMSPTLSMHATQAGLILGTAAYMSPEQAAGKPADKRSDIWAFGVVLLEMLTGGQAFTGETVPHVLASVLKSEPDWSRLPSNTPPQVRRLLRRCLEKDRKRRLDSAVAARLEIEDTSSMLHTGTAHEPEAGRSRVASIAIAAIAGGALMAAVTWALLRPPSSTLRQPSRFLLASADPLAINQFDRSIALSPDGRYIVYVTPIKGAGTGGGLSVRSLDRLEPLRLPGITGARSPFLSPDSRWIGFFDGTELKKLPMDGGTPISLCMFSGAPRGASWDDDGTVVFATADPLTGLWRVSANGGQPIALTTPVVSTGEGDHWFPSVLPEGRGVLFTVVRPGQQAQQSEVAVYDARTKEYRTLIRGTQPQFVESGHLLYVADGRLWTVRFDLETLQMLGDAVPMADVVRLVLTGAAYYAVSRSGTLVYVTAGPQPQRSLMWVDRRGREEPITVPPRAYVLPRLSPDGTRVALDIRDREDDIWIVNVAGDGTPRRLTYGPSIEINPVWIDNNNLVYSSNRSGRFALYAQAADGSGTAKPLTESSGGTRFPTTVAPNGAAVVGHQDGATLYDVALFPIPQSGQPPPPAQKLVDTRSFEFNADLSPNGRYLAYQSNESGPFQVIVRPFPQIDNGKWTISNGGGSSPVWSRDGKELFYHDEADRMIAVPVDTSGSTFTWGTSRALFEIRASTTVPDRSYDVSLDGTRFLFVKEDTSTPAPDIVVVLDWLEELKVKLPIAASR